MKRIGLALLLLGGALPVLSQVAAPNSNPRVRAITAFVRLDHANFQKQIADTANSSLGATKSNPSASPLNLFPSW